ncbi:MAG: nucleotide exchange factor GrpE [Bacteroidales bacterium]|nr:nucleotide exchange factor GrpE [Bacteroidales bacterium]MBK9356803.1 nucleotide exchange factor GrpE [Bacteroidales bacterium]
MIIELNRMKIFNNMVKQRKNKDENEEAASGKAAELRENESQETEKKAQKGEIELTPEDIIAELNKKCEDLNDKFLRLYSEFDNYRKRVIKEKSDLSKTASEEVITDLLPVLDDLERAIGTFDKIETVEPLKEGTLLIYNKFRNNLVQKGLQETEAMGLPFDTDFHEAIANVPAASENQKNMIIDVAQKGYTLNGKVIRFAKVVVGN